jgi:class 3 adenylate cyclase
MEPPETRYATSGDVHIAYQVVGEGPLDLVFVPSLTHHIELVWENPPQARFFERLASFGRLLLFDKRGTGMSDRFVGAPTLETRMDDIRAVMDASGSERAADARPAANGDPGPRRQGRPLQRRAHSGRAAGGIARLRLRPQLGDTDRLLGELDKFLSDVAAGGEWQAEPDRVLAIVLFTDIVDATTRAAELGDSAWRELLHRHHDAIRGELGRFRGNEVDTAGDGFFATFDGPARAIRCACAIRDSLRDLDLEVRAGPHTGECERDGEGMTEIAVHIGARVAAMAGPGGVLVSRTVKDLVAGSGIELDDRGEHELKGVPGDWQLFSVRDA